MAFLKKGIEYQKLAKTFNGVYLMIEDIQNNNNNEFSKEDIFTLAYICRREVPDRLEKYHWDISTPIIVPSISNKRITLANAIQQTLSKVTKISEDMMIYQDVKEILDRGDFFYDIENNIPEYIKNIAF